MYKIAHISDVHITFKDEDGHGKRFIELLKDINERNCDHIFITGDIVDRTGVEDFHFAREILTHFDLLNSAKLSVIPGNHDIYSTIPKGQTFFMYSSICKETVYEKALDTFIESFKEAFPSNNSFPYLKKINNIAIIGINSIAKWSLEKNPEGSNGEISKEDFEKLKTILTSYDIKDLYKIVLIHHHFNRADLSEEEPAHSMWLKIVNWKMRLYNKKQIMKLFRENNVNLILHGHTHITNIYNINGLSFVNSSACDVPLTDDQLRKYSIIHIPGETDGDKTIRVETITL